MIKYTILYKNGKTWNGKCNLLRDIRTHKLEPQCVYDIPVWVSIDNKPLSYGDIIRFMLDVGDNGGNYTKYSTYRILGGGRFMMLIDTVFIRIKPTRKPNPASVTKKQKAFDKTYAEWADKVFSLVGGGGADTSIKAYKKWLWEQKQAELKSVLKETSLDEFVRVTADLKEHLKGGIPVDTAFALCTQQLWDELGRSKQPIKTTYTFWLGQDGSVSDEL